MANIGWGGHLYYGNSGGTASTEITLVKDIAPSGIKVGAVDTTHLQSTSATKTFIPGLVESGEFDATIEFSKAQYATLLGFAQNRTLKSWGITLPDSGTTNYNFDGFIVEIGIPKLDPEGEL